LAHLTSHLFTLLLLPYYALVLALFQFRLLTLAEASKILPSPSAPSASETTHGDEGNVRASIFIEDDFLDLLATHTLFTRNRPM
jgi:hypothetical protein